MGEAGRIPAEIDSLAGSLNFKSQFGPNCRCAGQSKNAVRGPAKNPFNQPAL